MLRLWRKVNIRGLREKVLAAAKGLQRLVRQKDNLSPNPRFPVASSGGLGSNRQGDC
jgi:hypothetical protein